MARVRGQGDERPMRGNPQAMEELRAILAARTPEYAKARLVLDTSGHYPQQSADALVAMVAAERETAEQGTA